MMCASTKQQDFWAGQLTILGRRGHSLNQRGQVERLMAVVPFGVPDQAPQASRSALRGVVPGIQPDDKVIVWGGGVYNWFDPLTLVRAVAELAKKHSDIRLFFMGFKHPNPAVPEMGKVKELRQLSEELGLIGHHVFFNYGWVPYNERAAVLLDADIGVSTHYEHLETAYSFRTRILDYLWAGLPIVATTGDSFGSVLAAEGIGIGVPAEDTEALAAALEKLLYDANARQAARINVAKYAQNFYWSRVLKPLVDFCVEPKPAADLILNSQKVAARQKLPLTTGLRRDFKLFIDYLRSGGVRMVLSRMARRLRKI
jgi:glycosyltransferase involved in cell wall biosynthesis